MPPALSWRQKSSKEVYWLLEMTSSLSHVQDVQSSYLLLVRGQSINNEKYKHNIENKFNIITIRTECEKMIIAMHVASASSATYLFTKCVIPLAGL